MPLAGLDNLLAGWLREGLGLSVGLLITGSGALILLAYLIRFRRWPRAMSTAASATSRSPAMMPAARWAKVR